MSLSAIDVIKTRRSIKVFDPVVIEPKMRETILEAASMAPSSLNLQPYKIFWIESPDALKTFSDLCLGQEPAKTASAIVFFVADISSWEETIRSQVQWMLQLQTDEKKVQSFESRAINNSRLLFKTGWFGELGLLKYWASRIKNLRRVSMVSSAITNNDLINSWATKSTALSAQNLMIAVESLGLSSCPMEGFDAVRVARCLKLDTRKQLPILAVAIGKKSSRHRDVPSWRRPLSQTVTIL